MKLFLFGASVFYLLGLKLTTHIDVKSAVDAKPVIIESKEYPEIKRNNQALEIKPEFIKKDTAISAETKVVHQNAPLVKTQKNHTFPQS